MPQQQEHCPECPPINTRLHKLEHIPSKTHHTKAPPQNYGTVCSGALVPHFSKRRLHRLPILILGRKDLLFRIGIAWPRGNVVRLHCCYLTIPFLKKHPKSQTDRLTIPHVTRTHPCSKH